MTREERIEGNILIADFLDWKSRYNEQTDEIVYQHPNTWDEDNDTGWTELSADGFGFDSNWNDLMYLWNTVHRKILIPILKMNPHLRREINEMIKDMRSCLKWSHIEGSFKMLIRIISWYNHQFDK